MKSILKTGDKKYFTKTVSKEDGAAFESGAVHEVYSTFAIARDAEWCCRLFVLEMKEEDEEGIGIFVNVNHQSPALINSEILFEAEIMELHGNSVNCKWNAKVGDRIIAEGTQGQKILKKDRLEKIFNDLKK
jgi:fluoroacetyl-CoA thioesterase